MAKLVWAVILNTTRFFVFFNGEAFQRLLYDSVHYEFPETAIAAISQTYLTVDSSVGL